MVVKFFLGPQEAIDIQDGLYSDIAMCLDECPPAEATRKVNLLRIEQLSGPSNVIITEEKNCDHDGRLLFGIVQGGGFEDLRIKSQKN